MRVSPGGTSIRGTARVSPRADPCRHLRPRTHALSTQRLDWRGTTARQKSMTTEWQRRCQGRRPMAAGAARPTAAPRLRPQLPTCSTIINHKNGSWESKHDRTTTDWKESRTETALTETLFVPASVVPQTRGRNYAGVEGWSLPMPADDGRTASTITELHHEEQTIFPHY